MATPEIKESFVAFNHFLEQWLAGLPSPTLQEIAEMPEHVAIVSVDVINGFCYEGPLASPRVAGIVQPIRRLLLSAWDIGLHKIVFTQDTHDPAAIEFGQFAPHCIRGTSESQTVPEFTSLPFFNQIEVMPKNSISSMEQTALPPWIASHPEADTFIVVGDCTDLCVYQLAMSLRVQANARQMQRRVIVPVDCVDTYDLSVEDAARLGAMPHPAEVLHPLFLYHMALNGIEIVQTIQA